MENENPRDGASSISYSWPWASGSFYFSTSQLVSVLFFVSRYDFLATMTSFQLETKTLILIAGMMCFPRFRKRAPSHDFEHQRGIRKVL